MTGVIKITGTTRLYAIIGDPIAQVRSPEVFTERFAAAGINAVLIPAHVPADRFDAIVPALLALANLDGALVTVPFKPRMVAFASRLGATAKCIGALNAMRREADGSWTGDMFDGIGFVRGAERKGERIRGRRVALFGAGGAGSAIACALADAAVQSIDIIDTNAPRAEALVEKLTTVFPECALAAATRLRNDVDMVVNASPVGMRLGDGMPGEIGPLDAGTLVGDVVITEAPTALIRHAVRSGCHWIDGRDMHGGQVDALMTFFASASRGENNQRVGAMQ
jgi:shikimate dehydrogenase